VTQQQRQLGGTIKIRVQPKASKDEIVGYREGTLRIRVSAPPQGGKANEAAISLLASALGVAKSSIHLVRGRSSREKLVKIESLGLEEVQSRIKALLG
jgi:uncharacterized protein (TIGR00251 family)